MRVCKALDLTPKQLAKKLKLSYDDDVQPLLSGGKSTIGELDRDEIWWKIDMYVSKRMGFLMAIKSELAKGIQKDRARRVLTQERFNKFHETTTNI